MHQVAAVVIGADLHVLGQHLFVQLLGLLLDALQDVLGLFAAAHQDDAFHRVVVLVEPEFPQARGMANHHIADVADAHGSAIVAGHHDGANILGIARQAQAAHVVELPALRVKPAAGVGVVRGESLHHLRNRKVKAIEPCRIKQHLVLHHRAAKAGIVRHAGDRFISALQNPILEGFQILRRAVRAFNDITIDKATGAVQRRQARLHAGGISHVAEPFKHHLPGEIIVGVLAKSQDDVGKFVERNGSHHLEVRRAVHFHFRRQRDQALHFL